MKQEHLKVYRRAKSTLIAFAEYQTHVVNAKNVIVRKLGSGANQYRTFVKTNTGYKVTGDEGFVAVDRDGKIIKLVDRLEFSHQNFTAIKNWDS
jgi:cytochrome oxidase Cu insertion factor (SCO1/SenC/PrrC family)